MNAHELPALDRALVRSVAMYRASGVLVPRVLLDLAVEVNRLVNSSAAESRPGGSQAVPETRKTAGDLFAPCSDQPARTLSLAEAASAMEVSERRVRQLAQYGTLEVRAGTRPMRIYADSVAAQLERRRRAENDRRVA